MFRNVFGVLAIWALLSPVAGATEFSADVVSKAGGVGTSGKIFYKVDRFRMDVITPQRMSVIGRMDKKLAWNIMHDQKMYMEVPLNMEQQPKVGEKVQGEIERKKVGTETVDGHSAVKYLITYKVGEQRLQMYQWFATDINFPVKSEAVDGSWRQEYKNIKIGPQADSLFELPSGYSKLQMPAGMNFQMPDAE